MLPVLRAGASSRFADITTGDEVWYHWEYICLSMKFHGRRREQAFQRESQRNIIENSIFPIFSSTNAYWRQVIGGMRKYIQCRPSFVPRICNAVTL
jgi:hypothetical protein